VRPAPNRGPAPAQDPFTGAESVTAAACTGPLGALVDGAAEADPGAAARSPVETRAHCPTARSRAAAFVVTVYVVAPETVTAVVVPAAAVALPPEEVTVTTKPDPVADATVPMRTPPPRVPVPPPNRPDAPDGRWPPPGRPETPPGNPPNPPRPNAAPAVHEPFTGRLTRTELASTLPVEASDPAASPTTTHEPGRTSVKVPVAVRSKVVVPV
jgi:hypothetical protein